MTDIHELLEQDHRAVRDDLSKIGLTETEGTEERTMLFTRVKEALALHMEFEEKVFYPAAREATGMVDEIRDDIEEHQEAKELIQQISGLDPDDEEWREKVVDLASALDHHIRDEEEKLFPQSRERLNESQKGAMGADYKKMVEQSAPAIVTQ